MSESSLRYWHALTTLEAAAATAQDPVVVLPLAAIEQHGPHLPLSTDLEIGLGLLAAAFERLPEQFPAWVLPPVPVGASREHARFAGTLTLDAELLSTLIYRYGEALAAHGVRRLVLSNSHGGNRAALEAAGLRLRVEQGMLVVKTSYADLPRPLDVGLRESEWHHGWHGGAVETAMMLHLRPHLVNMAAAPAHGASAPSLGEDLDAQLRLLSPEGAASFAWLADDLHASGVVGEPTHANAALGSRLVAHYGALLADVIADAKAFPLDRLA